MGSVFVNATAALLIFESCYYVTKIIYLKLKGNNPKVKNPVGSQLCQPISCGFASSYVHPEGYVAQALYNV